MRMGNRRFHPSNPMLPVLCFYMAAPPEMLIACPFRNRMSEVVSSTVLTEFTVNLAAVLTGQESHCSGNVVWNSDSTQRHEISHRFLGLLA
jgi:hypothetical protein